MKKIMSIVMMIILLSSTLVVSGSTNNTTVQMSMDGKMVNFKPVQLSINGQLIQSDVPPVIYEDRTLVPLRVIIENIGANVDWNNKTKEVTIRKDGQEILLKINDSVAKVNGNNVSLPGNVPPKLINGRTMVPIRFIGETLGIDVIWNSSTQTVMLTHNTSPAETEAARASAVNVISNGYYPEIRIKTSQKVEYKESFLSNPTRLVIDLQNVRFDLDNKHYILGDGTYRQLMQNSLVKAIRISQFRNDPLETRVVLELEEKVPHRVHYDNSTGEMVISFSNQTSNGNGISYETINGRTSRLTLRANAATQYQVRRLPNSNTLEVLVPKNAIQFDSTSLAINDDLVKNIVVDNNGNNSNFRVLIHLQNEVEHRVVSSLFTRDLVLEFKHTNPNKDILVIIDPGHGGNDPGAISPRLGIRESDLVLDVSHRLNKLLLDAGFKTHMTRTGNTGLTLQNRVEIANQLNGDLFVSVHANAATNHSAEGIENYYYPSEKNPRDSRNNKRLAEIFQSTMIRELGARNRGAKPTETFYVTRETKMPAVLSEIGFLTNPKEEALLATPEYRQRVAESMFNAIVIYFEETAKN